MRLAWAVVAGALGAGALAWWLTRDPAAPAAPALATTTPTSAATGAPSASKGPALYRWRDDAGVVQVTDIPPPGRDYTLVDVAALERRNTIQANPAIEASR
ncbi:DUF4124 domain-containing protein [Luteimonas kalidii]|uniref:DUF4124 domain-containing protein n=1 Tax=Luteimonas kalidii TaxID=3042025 RepID=A0ABT6JVI8_9GAMM|nr:DUF4124 domain-containing protein [Luteimonas kalidii]MDH5834708.1 DUF4124 domain-containing protein [Luteimonas kalidii]